MNLGFSYIGLFFLVMLFIPNLLWTKNKPKDYEKNVVNENTGNLCKLINKLYIKRYLGCFVFTALFFINSNICLAGDVPEALLYGNYPVYFGEVKEVANDHITIIQTENIKGAFSEGMEITYPDYVFTESPIIGKIYLCGYIDENNPLYIWEVDCYDTSTLVISNVDNMSKRMQQYLNEGLFKAAAQIVPKEIYPSETNQLKTVFKEIDITKNNAILGTTAALLLINVF